MNRWRGTTLNRLGVGLGLVALAVAAIVVTRTSLGNVGGAQSAGPVPSLPGEAMATTFGAAATSDPAAPVSAPSSETDLGVFEPVRGWIVYPVGDGLKAVNPADPDERHTLELPAALDVLLAGLADGASRPMPAGWSADGRKLALSHEYSGDHFVMNADGSFTRENLGPGGCCLFVTWPWLSPDGTAGLEGVGSEGIRYVDLSRDRHLLRRLEPPLAAGRWPWQAVWSADGSRVAFVTVTDQLNGPDPTLHVADFSTGGNHAVADLDAGHVRHIVWSPDGSQLLVVAGAPLPPDRRLNPLVYGHATKLLLVDTDGSSTREIASGYYVATAWSPDGTQIAAIEYNGARRRLVVMNADGSGQRVLVELPAGELFTGVVWHPLRDES